MRITRRTQVLYASLPAPAIRHDGSYADEFGKRHPKGYLLIDHIGVQWRLPHGRIRTIQFMRKSKP